MSFNKLHLKQSLMEAINKLLEEYLVIPLGRIVDFN